MTYMQITSQTQFFSSDLKSSGKTVLPVYGPNRVPLEILRWPQNTALCLPVGKTVSTIFTVSGKF